MVARDARGRFISTVIHGELEAIAKIETVIAESNKLLSVAVSAGSVPIVRAWKGRIVNDAYLTGTYWRSIHYEEISSGPTEVHGLVGTNIIEPPYPFYLEYGTVKMAARPTMTPAFEESRQDAENEIRNVYTLLFARLAP